MIKQSSARNHINKAKLLTSDQDHSNQALLKFPPLYGYTICINYNSMPATTFLRVYKVGGKL